MKRTRINTMMKNTFYGVLGQILIVIINFVSRKIFINVLGNDYVSINGLFTNIFSVLSIIEIGFGSGIVFFLYKPLADKDTFLIYSLVQFFKKVYRNIGFLIFFIGILLTPLIQFLIKDKPNIDNLSIIYLLMLSNFSLAYFFSYLRMLLIADQKSYLINIFVTLFYIFQSSVQIYLLFIFKNYFIYLLVQIFFTLILNIYISFIAKKEYPFISKKSFFSDLPSDLRKSITSKVKSISIYKIGGVIISGTDNIIISAFISIRWVGLISNYNLIVGSVSMLINQIQTALIPSIGNYNTNSNNEDKLRSFNILLFLTYLIYSVFSVCIFTLINDFIYLWIGKSFILDNDIVLLIIINFLIFGLQDVSWTYITTLGLYEYGKYRSFLSAMLNICFSIILAKKIGILGVLLGTIIAKIFTSFWYEPYILYKYVFKVKINNYLIIYLKYLLNLFILFYFMNYFSNRFIVNNWKMLFIKAVIIFFISIIYFIIIYRNKYEYIYLIKNLKNLFFYRR